MDKETKWLRWLSVFIFILSPLFAWGSVIATDETAVFASLSRMIWYSGSFLRIFIAMAVMFIPMLISFFLAHSLSGVTRMQKLILRIEERMEDTEGYREDARVMILGNRYQEPEYPENGPVLFSAVTGLFLSGETEYVKALNWYLATDYTMISAEEKREIVRTEEFSGMEEWPSQNCVRMIGDVMVVYLSDNDLDEYTE